MSKPKVSVIVTTLNNAATIDACLESIISQNYKPLELVVVDNFSTDNTLEIAKKYTEKVFSKGPERSTQRNYAVKKSTGKYVCIIDSDMTLENNVIKECVAAIEKSTGIESVIIPEESFGEGFWAQCKKLERSFYVGIPYMEAARFFYKSSFEKIGGYNTKLISGEDWDLSQRIEEFGKITRISAYIHHNEGKVSLLRTVRKKYYYASKFPSYMASSNDIAKASNQTNVLGRYALFLSNPKRLFANPVLGIGMLFMKTCEFGFGAAGYLKAKLRQS